MAIPAKADPVKFCRNCSAELKRKRFGKRLEDRTRFLSRETCGQACGNTKETVTRSAHQVRAKPYRKASCEQCGTTAKLHVHHKDRNWANDDPANLQTLCASCHLELHWREDREQRMRTRPRRPPQPCVICSGMFHPRHSRTQTCSLGCKARLLSQRTTAFYQQTGENMPRR